jgi:hypothetical protein
MAKEKKLCIIIPLVIYPFDIVCCFGHTNDEVNRILNKFNVTEDDLDAAELKNETVQGRYVMFSSNQSFIRLKYFPTTPEQYGFLQHEIFHCVTHIMDKIGISFILLDSDEAYSYLVGYITTEIYNKLW